jgi:alkaline phosphatase D
MTPRLVLPFLAFLIPVPSATAAPEGTAGPLVGSVTPDSAVVWFFAAEDADCAVRWHPAADEASRQSTQQLVPVPEPVGLAPGRPLTAKLGGLAPDTLYEYAIAIDGSSDDDLRGSFRTPPAPGTPHKFRMVLTSCMKFGQPQDSWKLVLEQEPHFHLTVGDTHYADTTDPSIQWNHHLRYRRVPEFAPVLRDVPIYSMWDDHDYGPNDSDGTAPGKENSLAGWKQIWANPGAGTPETPGAFYRFSWGEIDFFVVDGRYHRSPDLDPDDGNKRMLGDAQFAWLLDGLKSSTAKFKVVASGSTLNHSERDGW